MKLKNYLFYSTAFLLITISSLLLANLTLLPLIRLQLKYPQIFNYLLLSLILAWLSLRIILQMRQEKTANRANLLLFLKASGTVSLQVIKSLVKFLRFTLLFALFLGTLVLSLVTNSRLVF